MIIKQLCFLLALTLMSYQASSQDDFNEVKKSTDKIFIKDVYIKKSPDTVQFLGSILLEKGKIKSIGDIVAPYDAKTIDADSMYVYPGFIAGMCNAGMNKAKEDEKPSIKFKGVPPNDHAGITPEFEVKDHYNATEASIVKFREAGFALVNTAPHGKMMPGKSSLITTASKDYDFVGLSENTALMAQFKTASRMYPSTVIAIMAKWRDLYQNARLASKYTKEYESNQDLGSRPKYDKATYGLIPLSEKRMPVYFKTGKAKDIYRAIELKKELSFDLVLTDVKQGWELTNDIKNFSSGLLISSDLPKEIKEIDIEEDKRNDEQKSFDEKRKQQNEGYVKQAAHFEKENISFGFSFLEAKAKDFKTNLDRMILAGLSEKAALAALTTYPAKLLGMSNSVGTLDPGKMANLVISDKNYFEKGSKINFVIVEGEVFNLKSKAKKKKKSNGEEVEISGSWDFELVVFGEIQTGVLKIVGEEELEIEIIPNDPDNKESIKGRNIERDGNNLKFDFDFMGDTEPMELNMDLDFDEDDFEGSVNGPFGALDIEGTKITPNKKGN